MRYRGRMATVLTPTPAAHTPAPTTPSRVVAYDALRVVGILVVLAIHALMTSRGLVTRPAGLTWLDDTLHDIAVPLLTFVSGALVWGRPWRAGVGALRSFMRRRAVRVGLPYLAWSAVFMLLLFAGAPGSGALMAGEYGGGLGSGMGLGTGPGATWVTALTRIPGYLFSGHSWYHLYFVPMILTFYLLTPFAARLVHARRGAAELLVLALLATKVYLWPALSPLAQVHLGPWVWAWLTHLFQHLPHMALGAWFAVRFGDVARLRSEAAHATAAREASASARAAVAPLVLKPAAWLGALTPVAWVVGLAAGAVTLEPWLGRHHRVRGALQTLSRLSFGAYFIHPLILLSIQEKVGIDSELWARGWFVAAVFAALAVMSFAAAWLLERSPKTAWLIGE